MKFSELVKARGIVLGWPSGEKPLNPSKWDLIRDLYAFLTKVHPLREEYREKAYLAILSREKSLSTGIGQNVALPHASLEDIQEPLAVCCLLKEGIDFASVDNLPAKIIVMVLMPKGQFQQHIRTLAGIARLLNDASIRQKLLDTNSAEEAYQLIEEYEKNF